MPLLRGEPLPFTLDRIAAGLSLVPRKGESQSLARFEHQIKWRFGRSTKALEASFHKNIAQPFLSRLRAQAEPNFLGQ